MREIIITIRVQIVTEIPFSRYLHLCVISRSCSLKFKRLYHATLERTVYIREWTCGT